MSFDTFIDEIWQNNSIKNFATKKTQKQLAQIFLELGHSPKNVLSLGYKNAGSIALKADYDTDKKYDTVLAFDEYFTYADDEDSQRQMINSAANLLKPGGILLSSMRDYRNNPIHKRNLGDSSYININNVHHVIVEINTPNSNDSQSWEQTNFVIKNDNAAIAYELGTRRTIYFKQLAKYCKDAQCKHFGVLREHFWKSPWRRTAEHIAWARF
jgi:hypothetical protein